MLLEPVCLPRLCSRVSRRGCSPGGEGLFSSPEMAGGTGQLITAIEADLGNELCGPHLSLAPARTGGGWPVGRGVAAPGLHLVAGPPAAEGLTQVVRGSRSCPFIQQTRIKHLLCAWGCCQRLTNVSSHCNPRKWFYYWPQFLSL